MLVWIYALYINKTFDLHRSIYNVSIDIQYIHTAKSKNQKRSTRESKKNPKAFLIPVDLRTTTTSIISIQS